jgi:hypothetical protein
VLANHDEIMSAIETLNEVQVTFPSKEDDGAILVRRCAPMDYGPGRSSNTDENRYHFWDLESDSGKNHPLSLTSAQILTVDVLDSTFDPGEFVTWTPDWHIPRTTWGEYG